MVWRKGEVRQGIYTLKYKIYIDKEKKKITKEKIDKINYYFMVIKNFHIYAVVKIGKQVFSVIYVFCPYSL